MAWNTAPEGWEDTVTDAQKAVLLACVAESNGVYKLTEPFVEGGHLCATNGDIAVRMPTKLQPSPDNWKVPPVSGVMVERDVAAWYELLEFREPEVHVCKECRGTGEKTCYACGHDHDCKECDGLGQMECPGVAVKLGTELISQKYAALLWSVGVRSIGVQERKDGKVKPLVFLGDGYEGRLMPLNEVYLVGRKTVEMKRLETA